MHALPLTTPRAPLHACTQGDVIFNDTFDQLGENKGRADYDIDPSRFEVRVVHQPLLTLNAPAASPPLPRLSSPTAAPTFTQNTGFANSAAFFFSMKFDAEGYGLNASWADISVYAGMLSVAMCGGPAILFVPGRVDSDEADAPGLLPAPTASLEEILGSLARMGLGTFDAVTLQSSHTTACFLAGCLDSTPNK